MFVETHIMYPECIFFHCKCLNVCKKSFSLQDTLNEFWAFPVDGNSECRSRCRRYAPEDEQDLPTENRIAQHVEYFPQKVNVPLCLIVRNCEKNECQRRTRKSASIKGCC